MIPSGKSAWRQYDERFTEEVIHQFCGKEKRHEGFDYGRNGGYRIRSHYKICSGRASAGRNGPPLDRNLIRPIEDKIDIELADLLDIPRIFSILKKYEITHIIHTAALVGAMSNLNPPQSIHINVVGTLNILEAARLMKVQRVVYTSAKGVYGHIEGEYAHPTFKPLAEDYPRGPSVSTNPQSSWASIWDNSTRAPTGWNLPPSASA